MNLQLGFRYNIFCKDEIAWENVIKTVYGICSCAMSISAVLASPKHWAFTWSYRSSI